MKGITPVIAVIMLLMITIAVIGFAFGYFSTIMESMGGAATSQANQTANRMQKVVSAENALFSDSANYVNVTMRNVGSVIIDGENETSVYIDNVPTSFVGGDWSPDADIEESTVATVSITYTGSTCVTIKIVGPANEDTVACSSIP